MGKVQIKLGLTFEKDLKLLQNYHDVHTKMLKNVLKKI